MVSIILPTYNGEKYIGESIESVINQTYTNWELIVIDDCSTDSTNSIVTEYSNKDARIKIYRNEKNLKLPSSLNIGFSKATGDYLTWTSDDNLYKVNAIEKMLDVLQKDRNCGLVFTRMECIRANGTVKSLSYAPKSVSELYYRNIVGASFMYTREVYKRIGDYNVEKFLVEDHDYWLRIAKFFEVKYIPDILYQYRQHNESLTESRNKYVLEGKVKLLEEELYENDFDKFTLRMIYKELTEALFSLDRYAEMKHYYKRVKGISTEVSDIRKAVRISCIAGPFLSAAMKRIVKRTRKRKKED